MPYLWTWQLAAFQLFSNVWRYFPAAVNVLLFCQSTHSTQAKVWMSGQLHLPAPAWVAYLAADLLQIIWAHLAAAGKSLMFGGGPRGEIGAPFSQHKPHFLLLEWKLKSAVRKNIRIWLCWEIIRSVLFGFCCESWGHSGSSDMSGRIEELSGSHSACQCVCHIGL